MNIFANNSPKVESEKSNHFTKAVFPLITAGCITICSTSANAQDKWRLIKWDHKKELFYFKDLTTQGVVPTSTKGLYIINYEKLRRFHYSSLSSALNSDAKRNEILENGIGVPESSIKNLPYASLKVNVQSPSPIFASKSISRQVTWDLRNDKNKFTGEKVTIDSLKRTATTEKDHIKKSLSPKFKFFLNSSEHLMPEMAKSKLNTGNATLKLSFSMGSSDKILAKNDLISSNVYSKKAPGVSVAELEKRILEKDQRLIDKEKEVALLVKLMNERPIVKTPTNDTLDLITKTGFFATVAGFFLAIFTSDYSRLKKIYNFLFRWKIQITRP